MDDKGIVELFAARSESGIEKLNETYGAYCTALALRIVGDFAEAEECVNDAYLRVWETIPPEKPQSLKAYVARIVRNMAINRYKSRHAKKRGGGLTEIVLSELQDCLPSRESPDALTEDIVIRDVLNSFLSSLPKRDREMFMRRYWHMQEIGDIASAVRMTENHVYVQLLRLRRKLKRKLDEEGIVL
ncbi:MAG: sigma-70 family RNA polymerase sigma factor [Clostridia bacterium]|nr:sigma-70 family RNA polymerase sigma factor [Clostridia bacterium]